MQLRGPTARVNLLTAWQICPVIPCTATLAAKSDLHMCWQSSENRLLSTLNNAYALTISRPGMIFLKLKLNTDIYLNILIAVKGKNLLCVSQMPLQIQISSCNSSSDLITVLPIACAESRVIGDVSPLNLSSSCILWCPHERPCAFF